jgi:hypothetical protein
MFANGGAATGQMLSFFERKSSGKILRYEHRSQAVSTYEYITNETPTTMTNAAICLERFTALLGHRRQTNELASSEAEMSRRQRLESFLSTSTSCVSAPRLSSEVSAQPSLTNNPMKAMGAKITVERNSVSSLPRTLLENVVLSLDHLINARLHQLAQLLVRRTMDAVLKQNEMAHHPSSLQNLDVAAMLVSKEGILPVVFLHTESVFRTLPLTKGFLKINATTQIVVLPFVFTIVVVARIVGTKTVQVRITAPGAIVGTLSNIDDRIDQAEVKIDTARLHRSMKMRSDQIVKKAYDTALSLVQIKSPGQGVQSSSQPPHQPGQKEQALRAIDHA